MTCRAAINHKPSDVFHRCDCCRMTIPASENDAPEKRCSRCGGTLILYFKTQEKEQ